MCQPTYSACTSVGFAKHIKKKKVKTAMYVIRISQQTRDIETILGQCWPIVDERDERPIICSYVHMFRRRNEIAFFVVCLPYCVCYHFVFFLVNIFLINYDNWPHFQQTFLLLTFVATNLFHIFLAPPPPPRYQMVRTQIKVGEEGATFSYRISSNQAINQLGRHKLLPLNPTARE